MNFCRSHPRCSWEQGVAAGALVELDSPQFSLFGNSPFGGNGTTDLPRSALQFAYSAVVRQGPDGRLSQEIGDGLDGAALDGASAGYAVLLGTVTSSEPAKKAYFQNGADLQLNYVCFHSYGTLMSSSIFKAPEHCSKDRLWRHFPPCRAKRILVCPRITTGFVFLIGCLGLMGCTWGHHSSRTMEHSPTTKLSFNLLTTTAASTVMFFSSLDRLATSGHTSGLTTIIPGTTEVYGVPVRALIHLCITQCLS